MRCVNRLYSVCEPDDANGDAAVDTDDGDDGDDDDDNDSDDSDDVVHNYVH